MKKTFKRIWWFLTHIPSYLKHRKRRGAIAHLVLLPPHYKTVVLKTFLHQYNDPSAYHVVAEIGQLDPNGDVVLNYKKKICVRIPKTVHREDWELFILRQAETRPHQI